MSKRAWVGLAVAGLVLVAGSIAVQLRGEQRRVEAAKDEKAFGIDRASVPAPAATVQLEDGRPLPLTSLRGQVVFVNFWATWCPPCRDEMPSMLQLGRDLERAHPGKFRMVAVSVDEGWPEIRDFFGNRPADGALVALDPDMVATRAYYCTARGGCPEAFKFPESYIIDADGKLVAYMVGPRDWSNPAARRFLDRLIER